MKTMQSILFSNRIWIETGCALAIEAASFFEEREKDTA